MWPEQKQICLAGVIARTRKKHKGSGSVFTGAGGTANTGRELSWQAGTCSVALVCPAHKSKSDDRLKGQTLLCHGLSKSPGCSNRCKAGSTWIVLNHFFPRLAADTRAINAVAGDWLPLHWDHWKALRWLWWGFGPAFNLCKFFSMLHISSGEPSVFSEQEPQLAAE